MVLPFACVEEFLTDHPLRKLTCTRPPDLHEVIVQILTRERAEAEKASERPKTAEQFSFTCSQCKSHSHTVDYREAIVSCRECGACERYVDPSLREYEKSDDQSGASCKGSVPEWYNRSMTDEERRSWEIDSEIQQWINHPMASISTEKDKLPMIKRRALLPARANVTDRVVGALLTEFITELLDLDAVEKAVRHGKAVPIAEYVEKKPEFKCSKCGAAVWTLWESRRHPCDWGKKKRRRF